MKTKQLLTLKNPSARRHERTKRIPEDCFCEENRETDGIAAEQYVKKLLLHGIYAPSITLRRIQKSNKAS